MEKRFNYLQAIIILFIVANHTVYAQTGGRTIFNFMELSPSAKISALGGFVLSEVSSHSASAFQNPALLNEKMNTQIQFQHQSYFDDIQSKDFSYTQQLKKLHIMFQAGIHALNSGQALRTDEFGNTTGTVSAKENALYVQAAKKWNSRIQTGLALNYVHSTIDQYSTNGFLITAGLSYANPEKKSGLALVFRNIGWQGSSYTNTKENKIPFRVHIAYSKRLNHLPFIYHLSLQRIDNWNLRYDDPDLIERDPFTGEVKDKSQFSKNIDALLRHLVVGGELLIGKKENLSLRLGYNNLRNRELRVAEYRSFGGLSYGLGLKIYKFNIDYGYAVYHITGGTHHIGISTSIQSFLKNDL